MPAQFELTVRTDRPLFTIIMRPGISWTVLEYFTNGEVSARINVSADDVMKVLNRVQGERDAEIRLDSDIHR